MNGQKRNLALALLSIVILAACGGGGGSSGSSSITAPPATVNADPGGIWYGFANNTTAGESYEVVGVSISDGELRFIDSQGVQYHGAIQVSGNSFSATFKAIAPLGADFGNGSTVLSGNMTGTITQRVSLDGSYLMSSGERGTVSLLYDNLYQRASALGVMAGTWIDGYDNTYSIDSMGRIFGQDAVGCVYSGTVVIIDSRYNAYRTSLTISSCGAFDGTYSGLGVVNDWQAIGDNRLLTLQLSNQNWSLTANLGKL